MQGLGVSASLGFLKTYLAAVNVTSGGIASVLDIFYNLLCTYCNPYLCRGNISISFNLIEERNSQQPLEQNYRAEHVCFSTLLSKGVRMILLKTESLAFGRKV